MLRELSCGLRMLGMRVVDGSMIIVEIIIHFI